MRFLITGTAGFVGFHLARRLLADGHDVQGIDALTPYYDVALKKRRHEVLAGSNRFTAHIAHLEDGELIAEIHGAAKPDVIVHLAAQAGVRYSLENPEAYVRSNVDGTFNLLEIMRASPPKHFIFASTSSVYGANKVMPFRETDRTDHPLTLYAATKKAGELMAHSYAHLFDIPTTVVRFFTVYGPWGRPDMALFKFVDAILKGKPIDVYGEGRMSRDFTYVGDLVESIARLVPLVPERGAASDGDSLSPAAPWRVVNIGGGSPVELSAFIEAIETKLGKKAQKNLLPMQPGDVTDTFANADLLEKLTGYRPSTTVEEGVGAFVDWYREYFKA
ncbi:MAG: NAD-dependent epimerase [Xanthobacteraceae bacterium]|nr:NAD-dependent epimerase [Xanthobacteraceae bacterium]QYK45142.1 MAG: NAD-dependent epimerase [Xanthobacteraceae bacterium]HMN51179.1 NAD-dependent epimerase [Xanthobacteraceae bacterium]